MRVKWIASLTPRSNHLMSDFKLVFLGATSVGKTTLFQRYTKGFVSSTTTSVGASFGVRKVTCDDKTVVSLGLWDTAGMERFEAISRNYYRGSDATLVLYDVTDPASWTKAMQWAAEVSESQKSIQIALIGNKLDALKNPRDAYPSHKAIEKAASQYGAKVYQISAKEGTGTDELFKDLARVLMERRAKAVSSPAPAAVQLKGEAAGKGSSQGCPC
ncbi:hypothetical protein J8273_5959 [Carpediemonas membranifera]|uniref:Uncharacterized protein n=1 Tax=Carpediemonas membranifera TaxID=201153 RepID=A0A8J6ART4_9EUKA|nr:hypothetical protein J8273_5959 [Carpediemonas membranifera]|eukprot:KAG9392701.1 hypothetical protein J8273_5959 [Carpediemonas membranifera]